MSLNVLKRINLLLVAFSLVVFSRSGIALTDSEHIVSLEPKWRLDIPNGISIRLATDGERIVVSACDHSSRVLESKGQVYVITPSGNTWKMSNVIQSDNGRSPSFGCSIAISGDLLVVGENEFVKKKGWGAVHVFRLQNGEWAKESTIQFPRSSAHWLTGFGENVAIDNKDIIVPAHIYWAGFFSGQKTSGEVYIFSQIGKNWKLKQTLRPFENRDAHGFGESVVLSNGILAVGSARNVQSGIVYLFQKQGAKWVALDSLSPPQDKVFDFGEEIAFSENYLVSAYYGNPVNIYKRQLDKFEHDAVITPVETSTKYHGALVCDSLLAVYGGNKTGDKETYFVDVFEKNNSGWLKKVRLMSQVHGSRWIGTGMACLQEKIVMADAQGNIYAYEK